MDQWIAVLLRRWRNGILPSMWKAVGKLDAKEKTTPFLVCSKQLEKTSGDTIAYFVNSSLRVLYPSGSHDDRVLLLYTDAAAYMLKDGALLKVFYPELLHVTCLAHGLHRVCEELRKSFSSVNELIAAGKAVFLKAPSRVRAFKEQLPDVPLPPEPVVTRWGTWVKAVDYYNKHFAGVKAVINSFAADESIAVRRAQTVLHHDTLESDLAYLKHTEAYSAALTQSVELILDVQERFATVPNGPVADRVTSKLKAVFDKNPGFYVLKQVSNVLSGADSKLPGEIRASKVPDYNFEITAQFCRIAEDRGIAVEKEEREREKVGKDLSILTEGPTFSRADPATIREMDDGGME
ncbi:hypothetical protein HPB50_012496 [Hyalomma asiaticum]|uniref:Uncharacterized protein n=1 Tax=Hyalomma asiaticum TaxID=266040 RepID=A0ACB7SEM3_HYAAI|nr:hypothetical protein HPB50_012496 [Hyalomma asiaticum]